MDDVFVETGGQIFRTKDTTEFCLVPPKVFVLAVFRVVVVDDEMIGFCGLLISLFV